jgi:hypothetical protein
MYMRVYSLLYTEMSEHRYIDYLRSTSNRLAALFPVCESCCTCNARESIMLLIVIIYSLHYIYSMIHI